MDDFTNDALDYFKTADKDACEAMLTVITKRLREEGPPIGLRAAHPNMTLDKATKEATKILEAAGFIPSVVHIALDDFILKTNREEDDDAEAEFCAKAVASVPLARPRRLPKKK
jgi:hypothetical protein